MASKQIIAGLNNGNKFDGDNYDVWHRKVLMVLGEQEVEETLLSKETKPTGNDENNPEKVAAYENRRKKNRIARITLLSSMNNEFLFEYGQYTIAHEILEALKTNFVDPFAQPHVQV